MLDNEWLRYRIPENPGTVPWWPTEIREFCPKSANLRQKTKKLAVKFPAAGNLTAIV
jgi:hypothetical protein